LDPNDVYSSFSRFWASVASVVTLSVTALVVLRFVVGIRLQPLQRLKAHLESDAGKHQRELLIEFNLWTKLPYLVLVGVVFYFIVFNSLTNLVGRVVTTRVLRFSYNPVEVAHARMFSSDLGTLAAYALRDPQLKSIVTENGQDKPSIYGITRVESRLADEYRARSATAWQEEVDWAARQAWDTSFLLRQTLLLTLIIVVALIAYVLHSRPPPSGTLIWRSFKLMGVLAIVGFLVLPAMRYRAEDKYLLASRIEYGYVVRQLQGDDQRPAPSMEQIDQQSQEIENTLANCRVPDDKVPFWLERRFAGTTYGSVLRRLALVSEPYEIKRYPTESESDQNDCL
jgi:hypothetical protein